MVSVNSIRNEAWRKFKDVTRTSDEWKAFVLASAYNYKYDLEDRLQLYRYNSTGKAFADVEIWNRAFKRRVDSTAQAIPLVTADNEIKYVFEREHTTGRNPVQLYELTNSGKMALSNLIELPNSSNIPFEEIVFNHVFREVKMIAENQFRNDNLFYDKERYARLIAHTTALATLERLDLNTGVYSPDFSYISEIDYSDAQKGINIAYKYIDELITSIKLEEKEIEQGVEYENRSSTLARNVGERTPQVSNESQAESLQGKDSRREGELPGVSGKDSGGSRHAGHNANESEEREVWSDPRITEQRFHEIRTDNEQDNERESRDNQTSDNISRTGEIKKNKAVDPNLNTDGETASFSVENNYLSKEDILEHLTNVSITRASLETLPVSNNLSSILFSDDKNRYNILVEIESYLSEVPGQLTDDEKLYIADSITTPLMIKIGYDVSDLGLQPGSIDEDRLNALDNLSSSMFNNVVQDINNISNKMQLDNEEIDVNLEDIIVLGNGDYYGFVTIEEYQNANVVTLEKDKFHMPEISHSFDFYEIESFADCYDIVENSSVAYLNKHLDEGTLADFIRNKSEAVTNENNDTQAKNIYFMTENEILDSMPGIAIPKYENMALPPTDILNDILFTDKYGEYDLNEHMEIMLSDLPEIITDELPKDMTRAEIDYVKNSVTTALHEILGKDTPDIDYESIRINHVPGFLFLSSSMLMQIANRANEIYNEIENENIEVDEDRNESTTPAFASYENNDGKLRFRDSLVDKDWNIGGADIQKAFTKEDKELSVVINDVINKNIYNSSIDGFTDEAQDYIRSVIGSSIYLSLNDATGDGSDYLRPGFESIDPATAGYIEDMVSGIHDEIKTDILNNIEKWRSENEHTRANDEEITNSETQELDKEKSIDEPIRNDTESEASTHQTEVETSNTHQIAMDIPSLDDISNNIDSLDEKVDNVSITEFKSSDLNDLDRINELEKDVIKSLNEVIEIEQEANKVEMQLSEFYLKPTLVGSKKTPSNEYAYKATERVANREVRKFARHLASTLGYEVDDSKTGVNYDHGTIVLWKPDSDFGVYLSVDFNRIPTSIAPYHDEYELKDKILYRAINKKNWATGYTNNYINVENGLRVSDLYEKIPPLVDRQEEKSNLEKLQQEAVSMVNSSFYVIDENNEIIENQFVVSVDSVDREFLIYDKNKSIEDREYKLPFTYLNDVNKVNEDGSRIIAVKDHSFDEIENMLNEYDEWKENHNAKIENINENVVSNEVDDGLNALFKAYNDYSLNEFNHDPITFDEFKNIKELGIAHTTDIGRNGDFDMYVNYYPNENIKKTELISGEVFVQREVEMTHSQMATELEVNGFDDYLNSAEVNIEQIENLIDEYKNGDLEAKNKLDSFAQRNGFKITLADNTVFGRLDREEKIENLVGEIDDINLIEPVTDTEYEEIFEKYEGLDYAYFDEYSDEMFSDLERTSEPVVWVKWSENPIINDLIPEDSKGIKMSYPLADKMFERLNEVVNNEIKSGTGMFDKTALKLKVYKDDAVYLYGESYNIGAMNNGLYESAKLGIELNSEAETDGIRQDMFEDMKNHMLPILENRELSPEEQKYYEAFDKKVIEHYNLDQNTEKSVQSNVNNKGLINNSEHIIYVTDEEYEQAFKEYEGLAMSVKSGDEILDVEKHSEPIVWIKWSENPLINELIPKEPNGIKMSYPLANKMLQRLNDVQHIQRNLDGYGYYDKTRIEIKAFKDDVVYMYGERFDIGDGDFDLHDFVKMGVDYRIENKGENQELYNEIKNNMLPILENRELSPEEQKYYDDFNLKVMEYYNLDPSLEELRETYNDFTAYEFQAEPVTFSKFVPNMPLGIAYTDGIGENENYEIQVSFDVINGLKLIELASEDVKVKQEIPMTVSEMIYELENYTFSEFVHNDASFEKMEVIDYLVDMSKTDDPRAKSLIESYTKEHGAKFIFPNGDVIGMLDSEKPHTDENRTIAVGDGVNSYTLVSPEDLKELEIDLNRSNERVVIEGKRHILAKPNSREDQAKVDKLFEKYGWNEIPKPNKETQEHLKIEDYSLVGMPVTFQGEDYIIGGSSHTSDGISYLNLNSKDNIGITSVMYSDIRPVSGVTADSNILSQFRNSEEATIDDVKKQDVSEISNTEFNNDGNVSNFTIENENLGNYTPKERYQKNIEAIELLRDLDSDNRPATHEEKVVLSEFTGFGGIPQVFDETDASWAKEHDELKSLISDSEYLSARASVLNAHYTSPIVIEEMYNTISKMGITQGRALEPAVGTGNFLGMLPNEMNMKFTGVELDELTGRIAKNIYDDSEIIIGGFEDYRASDNTFDLAVGNVPFGNYQLNDTRYDKHKFLIHDYFFAKTLDKVKPNGVIAFITSSGTMDKQNPKVREYLAERADLLGAVRLPNTAFKDNANTEVTADILFFQKREYLRNINVDRPIWVDTSKVNGHDLNRHFIQNEKAIVGDLKEISGRFGPELACVLDEKSRYKELLSQAMSTVNTNILLPETSFEHQNEVLNNVVAPANLRPFSYFVQDGELYFKKESSFDVEHINEQGKKRERIEAMIELRDDLRQLIDMQTGDYSDAEIKEFQNTFSEKYDNFVKDNGRISKVKDENGKFSVANSIAFSRDVSFPLLQSLENIKDEMFESKADIFTKRTISKHIAPTYASNGYEALSISLNEKGYVDLDYMSELTDKPKLELVKELDGVIFRDNKETIAKSGSGVDNFHNLENGVYVTADEFLSGNIREKLEVERAIFNNYSDTCTDEVKNDIEKNIQALEEVMPEPLTATEISVSMQAPWIPPSDVKAFAKELLDEYYDYFEVEKCELNGKYNISNKRSAYGVLATKTYGTDRMNALEIIEDTLNSKSCEVRDREEYGDSQVRYVINQEETLLAQQKQDLIKEKFESWIWKDINRRERLEKSYNEMFNSSVARHYDGDHLEFPEMSTEITLGKHQKDAVARGLYGGNSLIAHCVGAGKTFTMTAIAMESKRIGIANKSMMVVPNHLTEQWGNDILKLYPNANVLVATKDDFTPVKRQEFISKIAVGNYDAIVIGHSQFNKIPLSKERQELVMRNEIKEITDQIREVKASEGKNFTVKQLETRKNQLETKLTHLLNAEWKDDVIDFESLGIDRLFVDESDIFKNLDTYTQMRNVAGLNSKGSLQAFDMYAKVQYMNEITNNKGTFYATGTPISNSIVEMYTNQRTLQPDRLKELGINNFDQWASVFTNVTTSLELKPEGGGYQLKNRLSGYKNVPELKTIFNEIADIKTKDMLKLDEPEVEYITVVSERSDFQGEFIESLGERADQVRAKLVAPEVDNMLKITSDGRDLALDQRMINPMLPDVEGSKVNMCVDNVFNLWEETKEKKSTQLIFSDISTPSTKKNEERYCVYDDIKNKLIQKGIPENEIKFIHDATTDKQRDDLFEAVRKGEIRVLLGSTPKMGAGTNVQKLLYACHHLDCPWRPRDMEQREGRIIRQGNENEKVKIFRYVTKDTFDTYNYQLIEAKQKFISTIMTSDSPLRKIDDLDDMVLNYATVKAITVGDPYIKEKMELDIDLTKLKTMKASFMSNKYEMESNIQKHYPQQITRFENMIKNTEDDLETFKNNNQIDAEGKSIFSSMVIDGKEYKDKSEAGEVFKKVIPKCTVRSPKKIASYKGFDIAISFNDYFKNYMCHIIGKESYEFELGTNASGNMQRLENAFSKIEQKYKTAKTRLEDIKHNLVKAKEEVGKEFPHEKELADKIKRLKEVESAINNRSKTNNKKIEPGFAI